MDKILIYKMKFRATHGCSEFEKSNSQIFEVDIELDADLSKSMEDDSINSTIDYSIVYKLVEKVVLDNTFNLIEKLASSIIDQIFEQFDINKVTITIRKPNAPINGKFDHVGVRIERENAK